MNIVRGATGYREDEQAQCYARHAPPGRAFVGSSIGLVAVPENEKAPPAGRAIPIVLGTSASQLREISKP